MAADGQGWSLPTRGAWIENAIFVDVADASFRRSLHGERGLKSPKGQTPAKLPRSLPSQGAWIENSATVCPPPKKIIRIFRIIFLFRHNSLDFYTDCGIMLA